MQQDKRLGWTYSKFVFMYVLNYMIVSIFMPFLPLYYHNIGFNYFQIGVLTAIGPFSSIFIQPVWAVTSDKLQSHKRVLQIVIVGSLGTILLFFIAESFLAIFWVVLLFFSFFSAIMPMSDSITLGFTRKTRTRFSYIRLGGTIGFAAMVIVSGLIFDVDPRHSFGAAAIGFFLLLIVTFFIPTFSNPKEKKRSGLLKELLQNRRFVCLLAFLLMIYTSISAVHSFLSVYISDLGYSGQFVGFAMAISASSEIPVLLLIDRLYKRFSMGKMLLFAGFITVLRLTLLMLSSHFAGIALSQAMHGMTYMIAYFTGITFINREIPERMRTAALSMTMVMHMGLGVVLGSILGGFIAQMLSLRATFLVYAISMLIAAVLATFLYRRRHANGLLGARTRDS